MNKNIKITGGLCRGRPLFSFAGNRTRPTSSKVRQALFNILGSCVGDRFIDLYAGTGSVGLEGLSRGAKEVFFVEKHRPTAQVIEKNLQILGLIGGKVLCSDVVTFVQQTRAQWDIVFVDPPFVETYPSTELFANLVQKNGVLIFQYPAKTPPEWFRVPDKVYEYGESSLAFFYY